MRGTISLAAFLSEQSEGRKFPLCVSLVSDLFPFPKISLERRGFEARHPRFAAPQIERVPGTVSYTHLLGLSIVHKIVEAHDGTIEVASTPGEGTVFKLRFPFVA